MLDKLDPDERKFYDSQYHIDESSATTEQIAVMVKCAARQFMTKEQILQKLIELHQLRDDAYYASRQFPCITADGTDAVRAHVRNAMSNIYQQIDTDMHQYRRMAHLYDDDEAFMDQIWKLQDDKDNIEKQLQDKWDAVKLDMFPPGLWARRIARDHEEALRENAQFDKKRALEAALAMLPPEQQDLVRKELK